MPAPGHVHQGIAEGIQSQRHRESRTREFCADCGTHLLTKTSKMPGAVLIKVGTLTTERGLQMAIFFIDKQSFHHLPEGVPGRALAGLTA
jgi:hypothetical protein